jgi:hypothetical protein
MSHSTKSQKDLFLFLGAGILLCVELVLLLSQMRIGPFRFLLGREKDAHGIIGQVVEKSKELKDRSSSSLTWYPLAKGDSIRAADTVMTGPGASARLKILGEGELILGADTLINFAVDRSNPKRSILQLELDAGEIRLASKSAPVTIRLKDRNLILKSESEVVLSRAPATRDAKMSVKKGEAEIVQAVKEESLSASPVPVVSVKQGEIVKLSNDSQATVATKIETELKLSAISPLADSRVHSEGRLQNINFEWAGNQAQEKGIELEISGVPDFSVSRKITPRGNKAALSLPPGKYFWRLKKSEAMSEVFSFIVIPQFRYALLSPRRLSSIMLGKEIQFRWQPITQIKHYRLEISDNPAFEDLESHEIKEPEAALNDLAPGTYYWRVKAEHEVWGELPYSESYSFTVKRPLAPPKHKSVKPWKTSDASSLGNRILAWVGELIIPSANAKAKAVRLLIEWESTRGAKSYVLEVAEDRQFQKVTHRQELNETTASVELVEREHYFWRVAGRDQDGELGPFSQPEKIQYSDFLPPEPPKPVQKVVAPPKPAEIVVKKEIPDRFNGVNEIALGVSAHYLNQSASGSDLKVSQSGLPMGRLEGRVSRLFSENELALSAWFEPRKFTGKDGLPEDIQPTLYRKEFGAQLLWTYDRFLNVPLTFGLQYSRSTQFARLRAEEVEARPLNILSMLAGPTFTFGSSPYLRTVALLEVSPLFDGKGIGLNVVSHLGFRKALAEDLTPEIFLGLKPSYLKWQLHQQNVVTVDVVLGALLSWEPVY